MPAVANDDQLCKVVEVQRYRKVSKVFLIHQAFSHWSERVACGCPQGTQFSVFLAVSLLCWPSKFSDPFVSMQF